MPIEHSLTQCRTQYNRLNKPKKKTQQELDDEARFKKIAEKLLPCPLCGKKEDSHGQTLFYGVNNTRKLAKHFIKCNPCGLIISDDRRDKVIGAWNTRNGVSPLNQILPKLK